jgi:sterol desaturase/sphingolipid hydroxylase (fatty acid hydroxylase superfamily)
LFENGEINLTIIFAVALGCFIAECLWPAMKLPRVNAWWGRVILINCTQLGITILAGRTWNRWLNHGSLFDLKEHCGDWSSALIIYLFSTFVYYWWHRYRHESQFLWRTLHQIHHFARRLEIVTSFYKHPVEIWINSILSSVIVFPLFGGSLRAAGYYPSSSPSANFSITGILERRHGWDSSFNARIASGPPSIPSSY